MSQPVQLRDVGSQEIEINTTFTDADETCNLMKQMGRVFVLSNVSWTKTEKETYHLTLKFIPGNGMASVKDGDQC